MDTFSPEKRSWIMSRIRSKGAKSTELKFLRILKENKITGWRRNYPLPGKPDFVFPESKVAVFVDGCFWHGHPTKCRLPRTNRNYWKNKIEKNIKRDKSVSRQLRKKGWSVIRIWEHKIEDASTLNRLKRALARNEE